MAYCTLDDIKEQIPESELIQLTDDEDLGIVDASITDRAIADADAEINSYCAERYTVPFDPVPDIIRKRSVDIAIYNLFSRRQIYNENRSSRHKDDIRFLERVSSGSVSLGPNAPAETSQDTVGVSTVKTDRIFSTGRTSDSSAGSLDNY